MYVLLCCLFLNNESNELEICNSIILSCVYSGAFYFYKKINKAEMIFLYLAICLKEQKEYKLWIIVKIILGYIIQSHTLLDRQNTHMLLEIGKLLKYLVGKVWQELHLSVKQLF